MSPPNGRSTGAPDRKVSRSPELDQLHGRNVTGSSGDSSETVQSKAPDTSGESAQPAFTNISAEEACNELSEIPDIVLLDVRTEAEYTGELGHLKDALQISVTDLKARIDELEEYKNRPLLVYCRSGARSFRASGILASNGFTNVRNLLGGMSGWNSAVQESVPCKEEMLVK